jgi:hypothetical protein
MRRNEAGDLTVAYAQVMDQNRPDAMKNLEELTKSAIVSREAAEQEGDETIGEMRQ